MRNELDLEAIRARAAAATPGPWYWAPEHPEFSDVFSESDFVLPGDTPLMQFEPDRNGPADAEFVAYARQDVPALLAEVERLRAELDTMTHVARGNKRHVAENVAILDRVEALTKDAAGADLNGSEIVVVGKIRRALHDPMTVTRPYLTGGKS